MKNRLYYICDPNLPVATKKRQGWNVGQVHFFNGETGDLICVAPKARVALPHKQARIAVDLASARKLSGFSPNAVIAYHTEGFVFEDEQAFVESVKGSILALGKLFPIKSGVRRTNQLDITTA